MTANRAILPPMAGSEDESIAQRLKRTREAMGLKPAAWCRLVDIEPAAWANYESGLRRISIDQALKVCRATGVSLDWIYRGLMQGMPVDLATKLQGRSPARRR